MTEKQLPAVIQAVESRMPELKKLLPEDVSPDSFLSHFKTAAIQTPGLLDCSPRSVVIACVRAANDGLYVDGREAVIVVRNAKRKDGTWEKVAVYQRMYQGLMKRVRAALPGCRIEARVVRAHDHFEVTFGDNPSIQHAPSYKRADDNPIIAVYAIVTEASGMQHRDVMDVEEVMAIRDRSQNWKPDKPSGPWLDHFAEMSKKTVLNRLAKLLPQASGRPAIAADADDHGGADDEVEIFDSTTVPDVQPDVEPAKQATTAAVGNGGEITSGKQPFKQPAEAAEPVLAPEAVPVPETGVSAWKARLRELRASVQAALATLTVEDAWEQWQEQYKPVPDEVVAAAKGLIDKRLGELKAAAKAYEEAKGV